MSQTTPPTRQPGPVCIAGMHRSGTSMITRLMHLSGLSLGPRNDLLAPTEDNPEGYWESRSMMIVNDAILNTFGGGWDFVPEFPADWTTAPELLGIRTEASRLLGAFDGQESWGWKDPRNSLTSPFWRELVPNLTMLVCLRNPLEVAASLAKRGYASPQFALDLWLKYNRSVLANTSSGKRVVTHYESYFADPEAELRRVCGLLGIKVTDAALADALATTNAGLRHSSANLSDLVNSNVPAEVVTTYQRLCNEAGPVYHKIAARELAALDRPLPAADDEGTSWNQRWRSERLEAIATDLVRRVNESESSVGQLIGQLTTKEHELARLRLQVSGLEASAQSSRDDDVAGAA
ncbi:MAG: sulfotransferase [Thermoleophilia bacterium]|nr:sulfotransferase [Thermoleophilia bacterium]